MGTKLKIVILLLFTITENVLGWGFHAHKTINKHAVYLLPNNSLFNFFKSNILYLTENAVNADKRRYTQENEACRHYIDLDSYLEIRNEKPPKYYSDALKLYTEDTLTKHGILPWHISFVQASLTKAMMEKDGNKILSLAADLGHYIGDANVPLHTTHNYDGQFTNQKGIHALWESRIPELYSANFDYLIAKAELIKDVQAMAWTTVLSSNNAVDSVLAHEKELSTKLAEDQKYCFLETNYSTIKTYSELFSFAYSNSLDGQVERQMRKSIKMVADLWYTSWVEAGQPDLSGLKKEEESSDDKKQKIEIKNDRFLETRHNCTHDIILETASTKNH